MNDVVLCVRGVHKRFGRMKALDGVDFALRRGEVHALIGENGAGKSTLLKILSGAHLPDAGSIELDGAPFSPRTPRDALERGLAMIYQELNLAPHLSVEANVMLGRELHRFGILAKSQMRATVRHALDLLGHAEIAPCTYVHELGPGARQLVEVARALVANARVIVMDEPTSSLSAQDSEKLFAIIRQVRERGISVIYVSHFLEEVRRVADRFTVLRDGQTVAAGEISTTTTEELIEKMVGRSIREVFPKVSRTPGGPLLELENFSGNSLPCAVNLVLRHGEILGIAGLVGAGRTELFRALFGLDPVRHGRVTIAGTPSLKSTPWARLEEGVGLLSEDRKEEGLALPLSIADNLTLSHPRPFVRFGWVHAKRKKVLSEEWIRILSIRCNGPEQPVEELSGGNQQKVALARLLYHDVDVLLLDEPTRGIDVPSKIEVYRWMEELAARGKGIIFVSSYIPELLGVCDRLAVMHRGALGPILPVEEWTEMEVLRRATGGLGNA